MRPTGTVYGVILNSRQELERLGDALTRAPYARPPQAPVLYIKPPNTLLAGGGDVPVPAEAGALEMGATLALMIGEPACRVVEARAMGHVAAYAVAIDVGIPHASLHRPAIRQRCRDGFLPLGAWRTAAPGFDPDRAEISIEVNGRRQAAWSTADLVRPAARLLAEVTDFMTLSSGDVLLVGLPAEPPRAGPGDLVCAGIAGLGELSCRLAPEARP